MSYPRVWVRRHSAWAPVAHSLTQRPEYDLVYQSAIFHPANIESDNFTWCSPCCVSASQHRTAAFWSIRQQRLKDGTIRTHEQAKFFFNIYKVVLRGQVFGVFLPPPQHGSICARPICFVHKATRDQGHHGLSHKPWRVHGRPYHGPGPSPWSTPPWTRPQSMVDPTMDQAPFHDRPHHGPGPSP